ncbi:hypothetical protein [Cuspidothrix issatschenkoi]|nr:hypothetical protein [Cuspidothrix issatschenkoi]
MSFYKHKQKFPLELLLHDLETIIASSLVFVISHSHANFSNKFIF